jgi:dTDP-N-acetylfucosamine:lipid II N-acetylfucosaminyltransferase
MPEESGKILHVMYVDKFIPPFIDFLEQNFSDFERHVFFVMGGNPRFPVRGRKNIFFASSVGKIRRLFELVRLMNGAEKIILHGLFNMRVVHLLFLQPWLLGKCCWVIWGGDLYIHESEKRNWLWHKNEFFRKAVIRNISLITTTVPGDFLLAQAWYKTKAAYVQNLMYPSHLARQPAESKRSGQGPLIVQIGNSADPSNNHKELIDKLAASKASDIIVCAPLSYGDNSYRDEIISYGYEKLGDKFLPITCYMSFSDYNDFLRKVDIAIFNHQRQQGMGNTIALLSLGKKVYIRSDATPWEYFNDMGMAIYDSTGLVKLEPIDTRISEQNMLVCRKQFTQEALLDGWKKVFNQATNDSGRSLASL